MTKLDSWLDKLDKKLDGDIAVNRALKVNHLEHQKELTETLKHFRESLEYHHNNHEYQKQMKKAV